MWNWPYFHSSSLWIATNHPLSNQQPLKPSDDMWPAPLKMLSVHARNKQTQLLVIISLHSTDPSRSLAPMATYQKCDSLLLWEQGACTHQALQQTLSISIYVRSRESHFAQGVAKDCTWQLLSSKEAFTPARREMQVWIWSKSRKIDMAIPDVHQWQTKNGFRHLKILFIAEMTIFCICHTIDIAPESHGGWQGTWKVIRRFSYLIYISLPFTIIIPYCYNKYCSENIPNF